MDYFRVQSLGKFVEIIRDILYFGVLQGKRKILNSTDSVFLNIDNEFVYTTNYHDFGSCLYKYCCKLNGFLQTYKGTKRVVHYTTSTPSKRVNSAFLMGCYTIIYLKIDPKDIYRVLRTTGGSFTPFVSLRRSKYKISLLDCLQAIQKAAAYNLFNFVDFNVNEYDLLRELENGGMNWLVPRKLIAFHGPRDGMLNANPPIMYARYCLENNVKTVIQLNRTSYNTSPFTEVGIAHHTLTFPDGSVPPKRILKTFLHLIEHTSEAVAVHCKAGLGRTGCLVGAYIVKHYRFTTREAIAWMRICRPACVFGKQQAWLERCQHWLWREGRLYRLRKYGEVQIASHLHGINSTRKRPASTEEHAGPPKRNPRN